MTSKTGQYLVNLVDCPDSWIPRAGVELHQEGATQLNQQMEAPITEYWVITGTKIQNIP